MIKRSATNFIGTSVYGQGIGYSPSHADLRVWLQASLFLEDSHIKELALMDRGIFWLKLTSVRVASDGRLMSMAPKGSPLCLEP